MKEIIEKFGLSDFFGYLCPGLILLLSLTLWIRPNFGSPLWKNQGLVAIIVVVLAYALGMIVASFNRVVEFQYARLAVDRLRSDPWWKRALRRLYSFPSPQMTPAIVEANLRISKDISRLSISGLSQQPPWDFLVLYRTLVADRAGDKAKSVLTEADALQRRFRFAIGVALASLLVAVQSGLRLLLLAIEGVVNWMSPGAWKCAEAVRGFALWRCPPPDVNPWLLLFLVVGGAGASLALRHVAIRMWEMERYLTVSLVPPEEPPSPLKEFLEFLGIR